jgi:transposase
MDLQTRALQDWDGGLKADEVAAKYRVSRAWVHRLVQRRRETGEIEPRRQTRFRTRVLAGQDDQLRAVVAAQPDRTLVEIRAVLGTSASLATVWRALERLELTVKKTVYAAEQRRSDVVAARQAWGDDAPTRDATQWVFLDESGVTTDLIRRYGRSPRGHRLLDDAPLGHWQTYTVLAALRSDGVTAPAVFTGPIDNLCLGSEGAPTASESGCYVNSRAAGERRPLVQCFLSSRGP